MSLTGCKGDGERGEGRGYRSRGDGAEKVALNTYEHKTARGSKGEIVSGEKALRDEVV